MAAMNKLFYCAYMCALVITQLTPCRGQQTSLQTCDGYSEDTRCLIDYIAEKSSQEAQLLNEIRNLINNPQPQSTPTPSGSNARRPRDCKDIQTLGHTANGVYTVYPFLLTEPIDVYCDLYTAGGGWMVFQRRRDGSVNFTRNWEDYADGFGNMEGEFWLGNTKMHIISEYAAQEIRIELGDWDDNWAYAKYSKFHVASEQDNFRLTLGPYNSGTAGDSLSYADQTQNGQFFSTHDRDHDNHPSANCAVDLKSGFWYDACFRASLNYPYSFSSQVQGWRGIIWFTWKGDSYSLKNTEMKMRPVITP